MEAGRVSIVVLNWNGLEDTLRCIRSLLAIDYPSFRVLLVDNGSTDGSAAVFRNAYRQDPRVEIIENQENLGFAGGNNVAIERALTSPDEYVLLLNNDTTVEPDFLSRLVRTAAEDPRAGLTGPKIYFEDGDRRLYSSFDRVSLWRMALMPSTTGRTDRGQFDHLREVDNLVGCALLARTEAIRAVGMLDPEYFAYYEEVDWCIRMRKHGWKVVFCPDSVVHHKGGASLGRVDPPRIAYLKARNLLMLMKKQAHMGQWITSAPGIAAGFLYRIGRAALSGDRGTVDAVLKGIAYHLRAR